MSEQVQAAEAVAAEATEAAPEPVAAPAVDGQKASRIDKIFADRAAAKQAEKDWKPPAPEQAEGSPEPEQADQEPPKDPRKEYKYNLRTDEKEMELDYETFQRYAQKGLTADRRFEEAANERKRVQEALSNAKNNPLQAMEQLGLRDEFLQNPQMVMDLLGVDKFKEIAEQTIWQDIQKQQMDPRDRELAELKAREQQRLELEAEAKRQAEMTEQQREAEEASAQARKQYEDRFIKALDTSSLPKTPETVARMAKIAMSAIENGYDMPDEELVERVKQSYDSEYKSMFTNMEGEQIANLLGEEVLKKIREWDLSRVNSPRPITYGKRESTEAQPIVQKGIEADDFFAKVRQRHGL